MLSDSAAAESRRLLDSACLVGQLPSIVAATFHADTTVWRDRAGGQASISGVPPSTDTQYRIGSITKTMTAVAVMQLREEGRLDLDDRLDAHVPDGPGHTLRQLLAHSAGLTAEPAGEWWERRPGDDWEQLVRDNSSGVLVFPPGARFHYSNLGYGLLGELVARLRDASWYEALRRHVLLPIGMADTTYHPRPPSAEGTSRNPLTGELVPEPAHDTGAMAAAGQLWSTVGDLARWGHFLVSGADDVLTESTLAEMAVVQCADPDTQHQAGYGLGLRLFWRAHGTGVGHTGSMPGFMASLLVDRRSRVGSVILSNATTGVPVDSLPGALVAVAEADQSLPPQPAAEPAQAGSPERELEGNWYWGNTPMRVRATATGFTVDTETGSRQFRRVGDDRYLGLDGYYAGETLWVLRGADGVPAVMTVVTFIWTRTPYGSVQGLDSPKCAG